MKSPTNLECSNKRKEACKLLDIFYECRKNEDNELTGKDYTKVINIVKL